MSRDPRTGARDGAEEERAAREAEKNVGGREKAQSRLSTAGEVAVGWERGTEGTGTGSGRGEFC